MSDEDDEFTQYVKGMERAYADAAARADIHADRQRTLAAAKALRVLSAELCKMATESSKARMELKS